MIRKNVIGSVSNDRPRVTFALLSYNQEKYIRESLEAAFSQTYGNLEILVSDDCSADKTFDLISELTEKYIGPHRIVINRNPENLGLGGHINTILGMATGELVLFAAGDDISEASRTDEVVNFWLCGNKKLDSIWSDVHIIDEKGVELGSKTSPASDDPPVVQTQNMVLSLMGCSHATTKRLYQKFGPLRSDIVYEDRAIAFRALWSGGIGHIGKPLVKYRVHQASITGQAETKSDHESAVNLLRGYRVHLRREYSVIQGYKADAEKLDARSRIELADTLDTMERSNKVNTLLCSEVFFDRLRGLKMYISGGRANVKSAVGNILKFVNPMLWFRLKVVRSRNLSS